MASIPSKATGGGLTEAEVQALVDAGLQGVVYGQALTTEAEARADGDRQAGQEAAALGEAIASEANDRRIRDESMSEEIVPESRILELIEERAGDPAPLEWLPLPLNDPLVVDFLQFGYGPCEYASNADHIFLRGLPAIAEWSNGLLLATLPEEIGPAFKRVIRIGGANSDSESHVVVAEPDGRLKLAISTVGAGPALPAIDGMAIPR